MSEVKKKYFQQFSVPLNRQASEKVTRFLSSYKNSRYTDASDSTGTSTWYAVYAKRDEAGLDSRLDEVGLQTVQTPRKIWQFYKARLVADGLITVS